MKKVVLLLLTLTCVVVLKAQQELSLWENGATENNGLTGDEVTENNFVRNISKAMLYVYLPDEKVNTGKAVLVCPGGGYSGLAMKHEGTDFAKWLNQQGVTAIVLKYRMPNGHHSIPLQDAQRAMRLIRLNAAKWHINPDKVGVMGFSAGGHLASTLGTHYDKGVSGAKSELDRQSCRPDFMILFYPVITMTEKTHGGSRDNLLGKGYSDELMAQYSNELHVTTDTPPTILFYSMDDKAVPLANVLLFSQALYNCNVGTSCYMFPEGGHGWGYNPNFAYFKDWTSLLGDWLVKR